MSKFSGKFFDKPVNNIQNRNVYQPTFSNSSSVVGGLTSNISYTTTSTTTTTTTHKFILFGTQGSQGSQGSQGPKGVTGSTGSTGSQGFQGSQGRIGLTGVGFQGLLGLQGFQGNQGQIGLTGSGFQGPIGLQGLIGSTGSQGFQGFQGQIGSTGSQGPQGLLGFQGFYGFGDKYYTTSSDTFTSLLMGVTFSFLVSDGLGYSPNQSVIVTPTQNINDYFNATVLSYDNTSGIIEVISTSNGTNVSYSSWIVNLAGAAGGIGFQGLEGNTGSQGVQGFDGAQGNQGPIGVGAQGNVGNTGSGGFQGSQGNIGSTGNTGAQGNTGFQGNQGNIGTTGDQGNAGSNGVQGNQGNIGFQGNQGNVGSTGSQGNVGSTGSTGSQGFQGNQGNTGFQGSVGSTGFQGGPIGYTAANENDVIHLNIGGDQITYRNITFLGNTQFQLINSNSLYITGNTGSGINLTAQTGTHSPPSPGFQDIYADSNGRFTIMGSNGFAASLSKSNLTANRVFYFKDNTGTIPLLESSNSWSGVNTLSTTPVGSTDLIRLTDLLNSTNSIAIQVYDYTALGSEGVSIVINNLIGANIIAVYREGIRYQLRNTSSSGTPGVKQVYFNSSTGQIKFYSTLTIGEIIDIEYTLSSTTPSFGGVQMVLCNNYASMSGQLSGTKLFFVLSDEVNVDDYNNLGQPALYSYIAGNLNKISQRLII